MEQYPSIPMERTGKILRRSIYTFLQNYQYFTTTSLLLALPFSASILLSQAVVPFSPLLPTIHIRLRSLFDAAMFPSSSEFFTILNLKLSQTITSSILVLPFTFSFLLMCKASIVQFLYHHKPSQQQLSFSTFLSIFNPILLTQLCNSFIIIAANSTCFALLFIAFNSLEGLGYSSPNTLLLLSSTGAVLYSIVLANSLIVCNLALISSGMEKNGGYISILKACVLIRGRAATALALALPINLALAAIEALFQFRVVRSYYYGSKSPTSYLALEGFLIAYLYSIIVVIDTIVSCEFFKSCKRAIRIDQEGRYYRVDIEGEDLNHSIVNVKSLEDLP